VKIPVLHWGGWYDVLLKGTIGSWHGVRTKSDDPMTRDNQWLLIAPTDHDLMPATTGKIGKIDVGENAWSWDRVQMFFDYWLKAADNGWGERPRVEFFVIGKNEWRFENEWPLERTIYTNFYFHSEGNANTFSGDGTLDRINPLSEPFDRYVYDPSNPIAISLDSNLWSLADELKDRQEVETRVDVLVYKSKELEDDLEVSGPISVTLYAASSALDTDFTATLVDVFPDGYAHLIQEGIIRARFRDPDAEPSLLEPGKVYRYNIDLWATSYVVKKGHRLLVEISSSNFNRYDRNTNTGNQLGIDDLVMNATQSIYHTQDYPSHITLPVIPNR
jgi:putative CocE/NonD family hydrolase